MMNTYFFSFRLRSFQEKYACMASALRIFSLNRYSYYAKKHAFIISGSVYVQ